MNWTKTRLNEFYKQNKKIILSSTHEELMDKGEPFLGFTKRYNNNKKFKSFYNGFNGINDFKKQHNL